MLTSSTCSYAQKQEQKQTTPPNTRQDRFWLVNRLILQKWVMKSQLVTELFEMAKKGHVTSYKSKPTQTY